MVTKIKRMRRLIISVSVVLMNPVLQEGDKSRVFYVYIKSSKLKWEILHVSWSGAVNANILNKKWKVFGTFEDFPFPV